MAGTDGRKKGLDPEEWYSLDSFVDGLYEEMDKLARKAPGVPLSDLATQHVNKAIKQAKALGAGHDEYIAGLAEFVPAGDNPQVRDAVLVLKEIQKGLARLNARYSLQTKLGRFD